MARRWLAVCFLYIWSLTGLVSLFYKLTKDLVKLVLCPEFRGRVVYLPNPIEAIHAAWFSYWLSIRMGMLKVQVAPDIDFLSPSARWIWQKLPKPLPPRYMVKYGLALDLPDECWKR
jgi:hypothetical protein